MTESKLSPETLAVHGGQDPDPTTGARAVPIYQSTSFVFQDTGHAARAFALEEYANIYSRINNPTNEVFEKRMAVLEGGVGALAVGAGQTASAFAVLNLAAAGDHVVAANNLYGGTYNLFRHTLPRLGITATFVDPADPAAFARAATPRSRCFFAETIGNPRGDVLDIAVVAAGAHAAGVPLIVDNTFATPYLCRPFAWGADIVVHSATKFIGGHGTSIGGVIVDSGRFDWTAGGFPGLTEPDPSYNGLRYVAQFGSLAYIVKARVQMMRDLGGPLAPFNAWLMLQGLETLHVRMDRHVANAQRVAAWLRDHPLVEWVSYPGLPGHPSYDLAQKYLPRGAGAILTFGIRGGLAAGRRFIEALRIFSHLANVGDVKSLAIHPGSTTHQQMSAAERAAAGVPDGLIRLSIGIEGADDLIADLAQALDRAGAAR